MTNISEQEKNEIFKSFAFGMTYDEILDEIVKEVK